MNTFHARVTLSRIVRIHSTAGSSMNRHQQDAALGALCARMTLEEKVAAIAQFDIMEVMDIEAGMRGEFTLDASKLRRLAKAGVGSFLNSPTAGGPLGKLRCPTAAQWRGALKQLDVAYSEEGKVYCTRPWTPTAVQVPPVFGLDSIHGANYVADAVMFPHALHTAASFKVEHAHNATRSAARHTRAAGIGWVFAPVLDLPMNSRFPRVYESCGEDPVVIAAFAVAMVQGLQGMPLDVSTLKGLSKIRSRQQAGTPSVPIPDDLSADDVVAACMKHFTAYQASRSGYDRGPSWLPASLIRQHFLPPFHAAVRAGVASAMTAYNTPDDVPIVVGQKWTRKWLRGEAGFKGLVITDWTEIYNQLDWHHTASTPVEAISQAFQRTSVDMAMVPYHQNFLVEGVEAVQQGYISPQRLDIAVQHVLELKRRLGYLSDARLRKLDPEASPAERGAVQDASDIECTPLDTLQDVPDEVRAEERAQSLQAAKDGLVLVKNAYNVLPLQNVGSGDMVAVVGPNAETAAHLLGAWSYHWQGTVEEVPFESCASALKARMHKLGGSSVSATGVSVSGEEISDHCLTIAAAASKAIVYVSCSKKTACGFVYGEGVYAEVFGDTPTAYLPPAQLSLATKLHAVAASNGAPLIGVYVGGRDRLLAPFDALFDAHLVAFYPGPYGGDAIASTLLGSHNPCARLPITLHAADAQQLPYWRAHADYTTVPPSLAEMDPRKQDLPLYPFAHGLSFTKFSLSDFSVSVTRANGEVEHSTNRSHVHFGPEDTITVSVTITNTGGRKGAWPVLLWLRDDACIVPPAPAMVKAFEHVELEPAESCDCKFELPLDAFAFEASDDIIEEGGRFVQPGTFTVSVDDQVAKLLFRGDALKTSDWHELRRGEIAYGPLHNTLY